MSPGDAVRCVGCALPGAPRGRWHLFASLVLSGNNADEAIATVMSSSVLDDAPLRRHDELAESQRQGFRRPGALQAEMDHPTGPITGAEFLATRVFDVTVHAWDLARAIGAGERVDDELAACALEAVTRLDRGPGFAIVATGASTGGDRALVRLLDP